MTHSSTTVRVGVIGWLLASLVATLTLWLIPVEVVQGWALDRSTTDAPFEVAGRTEAWWWLGRIAFPCSTLLTWIALQRVDRVSRFAHRLRDAFLALDSRVLQALIVGWFLLAGYHFAVGVTKRVADWPTYRFRSGADVLPNISQSNRDVIRYVASRTEPGDAIFVASDQSLYFLSYYLWPRKVYYQVHPEAEFVIPEAHGKGRPKAWRLDDLSPNVVAEIDPDYVLEYFESPDYVDPQRTSDDLSWLAFQRSKYGPQYEPPYVVVLRRNERDGRR